MRPVLLLARLNEVDLIVDAHKARLAEIVEGLREPAALPVARRALAEAEAELARCQQQQANLEQAGREAGEKLARAEKQLYGGKVTNPKELENLQRDVAQLRRQRDQADDALLEAMVCAETATAALTERQTTLAGLTQTWEARQVVLRREQAQLKAKLPALLAQQAAAREAVPPAVRATYDSLRPRRGGKAVAVLDGDVCSACRVAAPPSVLEAARYDDELVYCQNCGRLLWGE